MATRTTHAAIALLIVIAGAPAPARAQRMLGQAVSVHAYLGAIQLQRLYGFDDGTKLEQLDGMLLGVQGGFGITPTVSILGNYATNSTMMYLTPPNANTLGESYSHDTRLWDVSLQFRRPFWHEKILNPLLQVGAGQMQTTTAPGSDESQADVRTVITYNGGVGLDFQFGNAFGVRLMAKDYVTTARWESTADPRFNASASEKMSHNVAYHVGITLGF